VLLGSGDRGSLWDIETGRQVLELGPHQDEVWRCGFSPDGSWAVTSGKDGTLKLWDAETGAERTTLEGHQGLVGVCAVAPDGSFVASGGDDGTVRLWGVDDPQRRDVLEGHTAAVWGCAVSPDSRYVATASWDRTLRVWDVATATERMRLDLPIGTHGAAFHPARLEVAYGDLAGWIHLVELVGLEPGPVVVTPREDDDGLSFACPACGGSCRPAGSDLGRNLACPSCGAELRLTSTPVRRRSAPTGVAEGPAEVHPIMGRAVSRERELMHATKSCAACGTELELLRHACPRCGSSMATMTDPTPEATEFMQMRQEGAMRHVDRGSLLFKQGDLDAAEAEFRLAIETNPWNATAHANLGVVMLRRDRLEEAIDRWEQALEIDPEVEGVRGMVDRKKAELAARGGTAPEVAEPEAPVADEIAAAQARMRAQDWDGAVRHYSAAIGSVEAGASPWPASLALLYGERATAHAQDGDYRSALADYDAALELEPDDPHYLDSRARVHHVTGRPDLAVEGFTRALGLLPDTGDRTAGVLLFRAASHRDLDRLDEALHDLGRAAGMCHDPALRQRIAQLTEEVTRAR
jgi:tetratricopeptide (TPR) repeat protein/predicted RNA-binding Zn-ribbon protein involved in translation (DUF1610 family)